jgi:hypothetical protein
MDFINIINFQLCSCLHVKIGEIVVYLINLRNEIYNYILLFNVRMKQFNLTLE